MDLRPSTLKALFLEGKNAAGEEETPALPPQPDQPPKVPRPATLKPGERNPNWPKIKKDDDPPDVPPLPAEVPCEHPAPHAIHAQNGELVAHLCDDCGTRLEVSEDEEIEGEAKEEEKAGRFARVAPIFRGIVEPGNRPGPYEARPAPRQSAVKWWQGVDPERRWLLYNGAALAGGFALQLPQTAMRITAFMDARDDWTDSHVIACYVIGAFTWALDHYTRRWPFLVALILRVPLVSLVIGVLLYDGPAHLPS